MHQIRTSARLIRLTLVVTALATATALAEGAAPPLGSYNADIKESSISGISSGAFLAVQCQRRRSHRRWALLLCARHGHRWSVGQSRSLVDCDRSLHERTSPRP